MTEQELKACREAFEKYLVDHNETEDPFEWHVWQYAWDAVRTTQPQSAITDGEAMQIIAATKGVTREIERLMVTTKEAVDALRPYLQMPQSAVDEKSFTGVEYSEDHAEFARFLKMQVKMKTQYKHMSFVHKMFEQAAFSITRLLQVSDTAASQKSTPDPLLVKVRESLNQVLDAAATYPDHPMTASEVILRRTLAAIDAKLGSNKS